MIILDLQKSCKKKNTSFRISQFLFPLLSTSYITLVDTVVPAIEPVLIH